MLLSIVVAPLHIFTPLIAVATCSFFVYSYLKTPYSAKKVAAAMGFFMSMLAGIFTMLAILTETATVSMLLLAGVFSALGVFAAYLNTFHNYCLGCEIHYLLTKNRNNFVQNSFTSPQFEENS